MFDYIKGVVASKGPNYAVVENNSIGFSITLNKRTLNLIPDKGQEVKIYTKLIIVEKDTKI